MTSPAAPPVPAEPSGLRERKKQRAQAELARVALERFAARGFDAVTVEEIADAADISRRTFFRYFPTKEDVLFARRREQTEVLRELLARQPGEGAWAAVRRALLALAEDHMAQRERVLREHALLAQTPSLLARDLEWDRRAQEALAAALEGGAARDAASRRRARLCAGALVGALRIVIEDWIASGAKGDLAKRGEEALDLLSPLAPKERAR